MSANGVGFSGSAKREIISSPRNANSKAGITTSAGYYVAKQILVVKTISSRLQLIYFFK